jgi:hypothetical protein
MNDLVGALGLPGALAALILALERGITLGRGLRNKNGPTTDLTDIRENLTGIRESIARIEAGFEARITAHDSEITMLREQAEKVGSRIAARCEEIIDPMRENILHLEARLDAIAARRR